MSKNGPAWSLTTTAPGKALILGEYAVLYGHHAMVTAVERKLLCRLHWQPAEHHQLVATPLLSKAQQFDFDDSGQLVWLDQRNLQRLPFIKPLFDLLDGWPKLLERSDQSQRLRVCIELDSRAFYHRHNTKLGLGSSAALTVALFKAWYRLRYPSSELDPGQWLNNLIHLHRQLQRGHGSGVDIAASLYTGTLDFRLSQQQRANAAMVQALPWPRGLEIVWIWLGNAASTKHMIEDIELFRRQAPHQHRQHIKAMAAISQAGVEAALRTDATALQQAIAAYGDAMQAFGEAADTPIYTDGHRRLGAMAKACGVAFKPSGAGGGDIALAAATDTDALAAFAGQCRGAGYAILGNL